MNARARNVVHRPLRVGATALVAFVAALVTLVAVPRQAQRAAAVVAPTAAERRDTVGLVASLQRDRAALDAVESSLAAARARLLRPVAQPAVDTLPPEIVVRRDSLARIASEIGHRSRRPIAHWPTPRHSATMLA